jgi:hypothetical protein
VALDEHDEIAQRRSDATDYTRRRSHLAGPFDMNRAQALEGAGRRIGDYQGLAGFPHGFVAAFTQARPRAKIGASDIFFADVRTGTRRGR